MSYNHKSPIDMVNDNLERMGLVANALTEDADGPVVAERWGVTVHDERTGRTRWHDFNSEESREAFVQGLLYYTGTGIMVGHSEGIDTVTISSGRL